jgi:NADH-quinone oxidoreductase subunit C
MKTPDIYERLKQVFGDAIIELVAEEHSDAFINVSPEKIKDICLYLRDKEDLQFDYLVNLSGMDYKDSLGVVYHLYSVKNHYDTVLKVKLDRDNPVVDSIERVWKSANWHEREAWDMFGIKFEGHPNLIRILCPYDWEGFPLRKDYATPEYFHGMRVPY